MRIWVVAQNTFREAVRDKVLYVLLFLAAVTIFGSKALGWISIGQDIKIVKDISLAATDIFGVLIAIFVGASLIYKEIDKRTLYTILSQPMHRYEFVLGKYFGLAALLGVVTVIMAAVTAVYVLLLGGALDAVYFLSALLIYWKLLLVTAFSILLSTLSSPIMSAVILFSLYVFGHATAVFLHLPPQFDGTVAKKILEVAYYLLPNLNNFNIRAEAANAVPVRMTFVFFSLLYGLAYSAFVLLIATLIFEEKDV